MKTHIVSIRKSPCILLVLIALSTQAWESAHALVIDIVNPGFEIPAMDNALNTSFDGVHGNLAGVPGWSSNESSFGGAIRVDQWYPGRTGNNVMYLHGTGAQNFHTAGYDLGVDLQSNTTYTLTFDLLLWVGWSGEPITQDYVTTRAGLYTGTNYDSRVALTEVFGNISLLDETSQLLDSITVVLTHTTGEVAAGTKFWIGGDAYGNAFDMHRATFDNFQLVAVTVIPEPATFAVLPVLLFAAAQAALNRRKRQTHR